jgi:hypothetical protein
MGSETFLWSVVRPADRGGTSRRPRQPAVRHRVYMDPQQGCDRFYPHPALQQMDSAGSAQHSRRNDCRYAQNAPSLFQTGPYGGVTDWIPIDVAKYTIACTENTFDGSDICPQNFAGSRWQWNYAFRPPPDADGHGAGSRTDDIIHRQSQQLRRHHAATVDDRNNRACSLLDETPVTAECSQCEAFMNRQTIGLLFHTSTMSGAPYDLVSNSHALADSATAGRIAVLNNVNVLHQIVDEPRKVMGVFDQKSAVNQRLATQASGAILLVIIME